VPSDRPKRRTFDAAYKRRILEQHDAAKGQPGQIGALLRREGLYSSLVSEWKRQRDEGAIAALAPRKRGRKTMDADPMAERIAELERDKARLEERLRKAEIIIDVQKKVSQLLGIPVATPERSADA
jgi:transposase-like protein